MEREEGKGIGAREVIAGTEEPSEVGQATAQGSGWCWLGDGRGREERSEVERGREIGRGRGEIER